jgi:1-deoxy-D-xylulose-5-phosphate synthase
MAVQTVVVWLDLSPAPVDWAGSPDTVPLIHVVRKEPSMGHLDSLAGPRDLRELSDADLDELAVEVRDRLVRTCSPRGGHLGPNLGVVELTIALHRVFESPTDRIVFDTGHQAYVHKMLTGRADRFETLRTEGGLSGYPSQAESAHDVVENSHASTALSYADGLAKAYALRGEQRHVVAVVGDGALTGGMAWEALNNIASPQARRRPLVIVVNDNGRSYTPTVGGLAEHLTTLRTDPRYEPMLDLVKRSLGGVPGLGPRAYDVLHAVKKGMKDVLAPQGLFEDLGLKYVGPVDGHDRSALEQALTQAKRFHGPVIVHALTRKGFGYDAAERHEADQFHSPGPFDVETGKEATRNLIWTDVFADEMVAIGAERPDVVAITAAMLHPVGLNLFAQRHPDRVFDVGIAEQHAVTSAAGLAMGGLHPVVAVYATFLNRAFDQVLLDVALHRCGVTFVLDRAGVTGDDGPSHNGMWDMSILQVVPGLRIAAPRDGARLRELLREAIEVDDAPTVVRFAKGPPNADIDVVDRVGDLDVLARKGAPDVLVVAVGAMAATGVEVADRLEAQGIGVTVVDPRWVKPVSAHLVELARRHRLVVSIEDNGVVGGCGSVLLQTLVERGVTTPVRLHGVPQEFLDHAKRAAILERIGLTPQAVARSVVEAMTALDHVPDQLAPDREQRT